MALLTEMSQSAAVSRTKQIVRDYHTGIDDEELLVICSPFEGRFHSIDFSFSAWTLCGRHPGCIGSKSGWTAPSLKKKCLDAVHDRSPTL